MKLRCKTFNQSFIFLDFKDFHFNDTKIILKLILKKERIPFFNHISYIYEAILSKQFSKDSQRIFLISLNDIVEEESDLLGEKKQKQLFYVNYGIRVCISLYIFALHPRTHIGY